MANRRSFLTSAFSATAGILSARDWSGMNPVRYPDADIVTLEESFNRYKLGNTAIQRLHTGCLWAEGTAWNAVGRYLIWSDIPNDIQLRRVDEDGHVSIFRHPAGNSNGNTFDWQGRQLSCEHGNRRVVRYEHDGKVTVLAEKYEGKPFNAPNDIVVHPNGSIWFTDPGYGSMMNYEGNKGALELKEAVYRIDPGDGKITKVTDVLSKPNGLCFSPDYKKLYVSDTGAPKNIMAFDVEGEKVLKGERVYVKMNRTLKELDPKLNAELGLKEKEFQTVGKALLEAERSASNTRRRHITEPPKASPEAPATNPISVKTEAENKVDKLSETLDQLRGEVDSLRSKNRSLSSRFKSVLSTQGGGADGIRCDVDGNVWATAGWVGEGYDGVHCFSAEGQLIGQIKLPEIAGNLCFGGAKRNRLFIAASTSIYAVYVETQGAHFC